MWRYLFFASYPLALIAVAYAFFVGRGRRWAWTAYGVLLIPPLVIFVSVGADRIIVIILGLIVVIGYVGIRSIARAPSPDEQVVDRDSGTIQQEHTR